ncbi:exonuclease III [Pseudoalteromonas xiamenensis]|uniref:Exonuclease III n=1 Tax=Pseudoalteromonas xiamenensis TaxID=882626 RepID=A0A975DHF6_9GAMM|nr:exonuclease III [Pseudoalteromonas xiamenensis]QTH71760.1 exonuclease III [Pseudoalteromonas xiamenensis]WMN60174.1 exonuclease III [Pseudoalteromonas xiamenensis]
MFKMLSIVTTVAAVSFSVNAQQYVAANNSVETQVCTVAANEGFEAASKIARQHHITLSKFSKSLVCNGEDIRNLAKVEFNSAAAEQKAVKLVAKSSTQDTALCLKAVEKGVNSLGFNSRSLRCNNMPVKEFVKQYQNAAI